MNESQISGSARSQSPRASTANASEVAGLVIVLLLFGLPLFIGLGRTDLRNDEAIYSFAVDRILETGDWLSPESIPHTDYPGDPASDDVRTFLEKPPLKFWIVAAPIKLGLLPHDEFGLRFWDALFGTLAFVYVYLIGRRLVGVFHGVAAVFLLFVQAELLFQHGLRSNVMDAALVLSYAAGIYHFLLWKHSEQPRSRGWHVYAMVGWFAFGFMMKFVASVFLPMVIGLAALLESDSRRALWRDRWRFVGAATVALLLGLPWFLYQFAREGAEVWQIMLGAHVVQRFTTSLDPEHLQPREYYFTQLRASLVGLGWVTFGGLLWIAQALRRRSVDWALIPIWYFLPVALISLGSSKLYYYTYPFQPGLMLMAAFPATILVRLALGRASGVDWIDAARARWVARAERSVAGFAPPRLGRGLAAVTLVVPLVWFAPYWPLGEYREIVNRVEEVHQPLRAVRDCVLDRYDELRRAAPGRRSKIYAHLPPMEGLTADHYYYYRVLDEWDRPDSYRSADLYRRLFVPGQRAPTVTLEQEYRAFVAELQNPDSATRIAAAAGVGGDLEPGSEPDSGVVSADQLPGMVLAQGIGTRRALVLLPGPFRRCEEAGLAAGGDVFEIDFGGRSND